MIRVVADTNVYISAIAFGGTCEAVLALARAGIVMVAISPPILHEFRSVLGDTFTWSDSRVREAVAEISGLTTLVRPTMRLEGIVPHDPDHRILECALAAHAEFLVTGNTKHFRAVSTFRGIQIVSPRRFLDLLRPA